MNGKKAKKLRRIAMGIAESLSKEANTHLLNTNPMKIYSELKKIDRDVKSPQPSK